MVYNYNSNGDIEMKKQMGTTSYREMFPEFYSKNVTSPGLQRSASEDMKKYTKRFDAMEEFRLNGVDSAYDPEQERSAAKSVYMFGGLEPASAYLRQKSWPAPDRTPVQKLPPSQWKQPLHAHSLPKNGEHFYQKNIKDHVTPPLLTEEQCRVLSTLPDAIVYTLLGCLEKARLENIVKGKIKRAIPLMCRFCRNNGERESYVRSHALKDEFGRVSCPVLRSFVCSRCGAQGDHAHTIKYCPLTTTEERSKSMAILKSMRMASGRRRASTQVQANNYVYFGQQTPLTIRDSVVFNTMPLDPMWEALEQKLSM